MNKSLYARPEHIFFTSRIKIHKQISTTLSNQNCNTHVALQPGPTQPLISIFTRYFPQNFCYSSISIHLKANFKCDFCCFLTCYLINRIIFLITAFV